MQSIALIPGIDTFRSQILELWDERPEQAYILGNQLAKLGADITKEFWQWFRDYFDENKELPGWFTCKITNRATLNYDECPEWRVAKARLEFLEEQIKKATKSNVSFPDPETWVIISPVSVKSSEIYSLSKS